MSDSGDGIHGHLVDLSDDECWQLLVTGAVGRIAWVRANRPFVIPVNFTVEGTTIHIHSAPYSALVQEVDDNQVAFQVDDIDIASRSGWTVTAQGRAEVRYRGAMTPSGPAVDVWPAGAKAATVAIEVAEISGRRLRPGSPTG
jgi:hypothetical protein